MKLTGKKSLKTSFPFILKILTFICLLFLVDFAVGNIIRYFYFKQESGLLYRTTYAIDSTEAEMIIFGSSYANHHYHSEVFTKRLHLTLYNAGRDGNDLFYHYAILKAILKRYSPKIAILDFGYGNFKKEIASYETMSSLLPYYESHPEIRSIIELRSPYEKYKLFSKIYPYNSDIFTIGIGNLTYNKNRYRIEDYDGFVPLKEVWKGEVDHNPLEVAYELDSNKINYYKSFLKDCIKYKIKLYVIVSPRFIQYSHKDTSLILAENISKSLNVPFFNFYDDKEFLQSPHLFADPTHLNDSGAKVFSKKIIDKILQKENPILVNTSNYQEMK